MKQEAKSYITRRYDVKYEYWYAALHFGRTRYMELYYDAETEEGKVRLEKELREKEKAMKDKPFNFIYIKKL